MQRPERVSIFVLEFVWLPLGGPASAVDGFVCDLVFGASLQGLSRR